MNEGPLFAQPAVRWGLALVLAVGVIGGVVLYQRSGDEGAADRARSRTASGWALPNADRHNSRVADSRVDSENVDQLGVAWKQKLWPVEGDVALASAPLIVDGTTYVQDADSNVWAHDLRSGDERWRRKMIAEAPGPNGVAYENGRVFGTAAGDAFALDSGSGALEWRRAVVEGVGGSGAASDGLAIAPMVADGHVLLGELRAQGGGAVMSLDVASGEEDWRASTAIEGARETERTGGVRGTPLALDDEVVFGVGGATRVRAGAPAEGSLRAFEIESGEPEWAFAPKGDEPAALDLHLAPARVELDDDEEAVVIGGSDGVVRLVDEDGTQLWEAAVGGDGVEQHAVGEDAIYAAAGGSLVALDAETGSETWRVTLAHDDPSAVTVANDLLFLATGDGVVRAHSTKDGSEVWTHELDDAYAPTSVSAWGEYLVVGATIAVGAGSVKPVVFALRLGAQEELEPEQSEDVADEPDEISDERATNPVPPAGGGSAPGGDAGDDHDDDHAHGEDEVEKEKEKEGGDDAGKGDEPDEGEVPGSEDDVIEVSVEAGALAFAPTKLVVEAGETTFRFINSGAVKHDFVVLDEKGAKIAGTSLLAKGEEADLAVKLGKGTYRFVCTPHEKAGMVGTIVVT